MCSGHIDFGQWNETKSNWEDTVIEFEMKETPLSQAVVCRRHMDDDSEKMLDLQEIEIHSPPLKGILAQISPLWKDLVIGSDQFISTQWPFHAFFWHWNAHQAACEPQEVDTNEIAD
jgi:hypothetical protein